MKIHKDTTKEANVRGMYLHYDTWCYLDYRENIEYFSGIRFIIERCKNFRRATITESKISTYTEKYNSSAITIQIAKGRQRWLF